jgi:cation diffusion facilitator family transporter
MDSSRIVVYAALGGNVLVAITKLAAAFVTHSSAMLSEALHSVVDTSNELLLLYGAHRAKRPPDERHPLGYGRESYFWSFIVSLLIFAFGAGASIYTGVDHIVHPATIEHPMVNYVVLGLSGLFEGGSWWVAFREFRARKGDQGYLEAAEKTKDPSTLIVFLEDSAALIGIAIALAGTAGAQLLDAPVLDGAASIAIGVLLAVIGGFLARENKNLLIGEGASPAVVESVRRIARAQKGVARFNGMLTIQLAPREVVAALSLEFESSLRAHEIQTAVKRLEGRIRRRHPEVVLVLVKPQAPHVWRHARARWLAKR